MALDMEAAGKDRLPWLAANLGVSLESLQSLGAGWNQGAYSFPEVNQHGQAVGIAYRTPAGRKFFEAGTSRGITIPRNRLRSPYALVVEGPSDVAACYTAGIDAVGRPSCSGGVDTLADALPRLYFGSVVIVVGENDKKPKESREYWPCGWCGECLLCWPGLAGAKLVADMLRTRIPGTILLAMPRRGLKDCRAILNQTGRIGMDNFDADERIQGPLGFAFR